LPSGGSSESPVASAARGSSDERATVTSLLTAEEVAERLGVTKDWVWAQARAGRIPHVRLGRYCRFREEAIEAWVIQLEAASRRTHNGHVSRLGA
jgi:excisionase family DNA binding protein